VPSACNKSTSGNCHFEKCAINASTVVSALGIDGNNRKPSFYLAQKFFDCMAILSANDQSVISKYEDVGLRRSGHCLFDCLR